MKALAVILIIGLAIAAFYFWQQNQTSSANIASLQAQLSADQATITNEQIALNNANGKVQAAGTTGGALTTLFQNIF